MSDYCPRLYREAIGIHKRRIHLNKEDEGLQFNIISTDSALRSASNTELTSTEPQIDPTLPFYQSERSIVSESSSREHINTASFAVVESIVIELPKRKIRP